MKKSILWTVIITAVLMTTMGAYGTSFWPQFKGNAGHTGLVPHSIGCKDTTEWTVELLNGGPFINGVILDANDNAVVLGTGGTVYSVSPSGSINWSRPGLGSGNWGGVAYSDDKDTVYATCYSSNPDFFAIDASNGQILWSFNGSSGSDSAPVIGPDGTVYYTSYASPNPIFALTDNGASGSLKWSLQTPLSGYTCSSMPLYNDGANNFVFHATEGVNAVGENNTLCVRDDTTTGTIMWCRQVGYNYAEGTVDADGNYYFACYADRVGTIPYTVFKFDLAGNIIWQVLPQDGTQVLTTIAGSPTLSADGSRLYVGGGAGRLWCLDNTDGSLIWVKQLETGDANEIVPPPIVLQDGTIYIIRSHGTPAFFRLWDAGTQPVQVFKYSGFPDMTGAPAVAADGSVYMIPEGSTLHKFSPEPASVEILTTSVANGELGVAYSATINAWGGARPYTWSIDSGSLPTGLSLDSASSEISGTPTAGGTYNFVVKATDSTSPTPTTDTVALSIEVTYPAVKITNLSLSLAEKDASYSETITTNGAKPTITITVDAGSLPPGVTLSGDVLSGTPTVYGDYTFRIKAVAGDATEDSRDMTITVINPNEWRMFQNNKRRIGTAAVAGPDTFQTKWKVAFSAGNGAPVFEDGDYLYKMRGYPFNLLKFNAATGSTLWVSANDYRDHCRGVPTLGTDARAYSSMPQRILASNKADGSTAWMADNQTNPGNIYEGFILPAYSNGNLFHVIGDYASIMADQGTGWSSTYVGNVGPAAPVAILDTVDNGEVMIVGTRWDVSGVRAIRVSDGTELWQNNNTKDLAGIWINTCPIVTSANVCIFGVRSGSYAAVIALDGITGDLIWQTDLSSPVPGHACTGGALSFDQGTVYFNWYGYPGETTTGGKLVALNVADGSIKWEYDTNIVAGSGNQGSIVVDKVGKVYALAADAPGASGTEFKVVCVKDDVTTGTVVWGQHVVSYTGMWNGSQNDLGRTPLSFSIGPDGTLYYAHPDDSMFPANYDNGYFYAVKPAAPPAPEILDMYRGSMTIVFKGDPQYLYKIESSTSPYDYNEANMTWSVEADNIALPASKIGLWTDATPPTGAGTEKYYHVVAKSLSPSFSNTNSETVGLKNVEAKTGRNMVSSPFEPFPESDIVSGVDPTSIGWSASTWLWDVPSAATPDVIGEYRTDEAQPYVRNYITAANYPYGYARIRLLNCPINHVDVSQGGVLEFDVRWYEGPGGDQGDKTLEAYTSTWTSAGARLGRVMMGLQWKESENPAYPAWSHVKYDLGSMPAGDPGFDPTNCNGLTFYFPGLQNPGFGTDDYFDLKNVKWTTKAKSDGTSTLNKIVGNQLTGHSLNKFLSDNIELWVNASGAYKRAWYKTGTTNSWLDWDTGGVPAFGLDADKGYWFNVITGHAAKNVMFCGRVSKTSRSIPIAIGRNLVGSSFPVSCTLAKSGLVASGFTGHNLNKFLSDNVEFWKNPGAIYERFWYKTGTTNAWQPWNVGDPMRDIAAGDSIWINVLNTHPAFTWTYPVPPRP